MVKLSSHIVIAAAVAAAFQSQQAIADSQLSAGAETASSNQIKQAPVGVLALLVGAGAKAADPAASAQTSSSATTTGPIEEVVVTASKREQDINSVPMTINAVTGEKMLEMGVTSVSDLTKIVPGFQASDSGFGQPVYFLRGVGFYDSSLQAKPTVTVYTDEFPLPYSVMTVGASFDLERVEVLKGPQGTLYGQNATGGAINYIAAKPTSDFNAGVDVSYGRFNDTDVSGFVSGSLSDTVTARLALRHEGANGWQKDYISGETNGAKDFTQGRLIVDWQPVQSFKAELNLNGFYDGGDTQAPQFEGAFGQSGSLYPPFASYPVAPNDDRAASWGGNNVAPVPVSLAKHNGFGQANLRMDYDFTPDMTLTSLTSISYYQEGYGLNTSGTNIEVLNDVVTGQIQTQTQELRLAGQFTSKDHWVIGGDYEHDHVDEVQNNILYYESATQAFVNAFHYPCAPWTVCMVNGHNAQQYGGYDISHQKYESEGVFANLDYDLLPTVTGHIGARYTNEDTRFAGCFAPRDTYFGYAMQIIFGTTLWPTVPTGYQCATIAPDNTNAGLVHKDLAQDNFSWRTGLDWKPRKGLMIYGNVSRGFKSGSFPTVSAINTNQYVPVSQERLTAYELGFKSTLLKETLQLNGALFYYEYGDKQLKGRILVPIWGLLGALINIPKSHVEGAELQALWQPIDGLKVNVGGTYLKTRVDGHFLSFDSFDSTKTDFNGSQFPYTPKWQLNGDVEYDWPVSDSLLAFTGATLTYRSATNSEFIPAAATVINAYTLLDLRTGVTTDDGAWRVTLAGHNVTNQYYWTQALRNADAIVRYAGMPATYTVSVSYRFQ